MSTPFSKKLFSKKLKKGVDIFAGLCYYILTGRDKSPPEERKARQ
jgi:hypothetical protein